MAHNLPSSYQSTSDQQPDVRLSAYTHSLDEIKDMLTGIEAESEFEKSMKTVVSLLIDQIKDWRLEMLKKNQSVDDMNLHSVSKNEQFTRSDVFTAVSPPLSDGPESQTDLKTKVQAQTLSLSGEEVKPIVLSAPRRNSRTKRVSFRGKTAPQPLSEKLNLT